MYFDMGSLPFRRIDTVEELAEHLNKKLPFCPDKGYLEFCKEYCEYDNENTPEYVSNVIQSKSVPDSIRIDSFEENGAAGYHVCFMSNLKSPYQRAQFEYLAENAGKHNLFVFAQ